MAWVVLSHRWHPTEGDAVAVFQVLAGLRISEAGIEQQLPDSGALVEAVFEQQPTAGVQMRRGLRGDVAQGVEPVAAAGQGVGRFEAQVAALQMRVAVCDVGWIAGDQVELFAFERCEPVAVTKGDIAQSEALRVGLGDPQCIVTGIGGDHAGLWSLAGQCQGNRAAARAQIGDAGMAGRREMFKGGFDQQFGFRARDQGGRGDVQIQGPESGAPQNVGDRFAAAATFNQCGVTLHSGGFELIARMHEEPRAVHIQRVFKQQFGFAPAVALRKAFGGPAQQRRNVGRGRNRVGFRHHVGMVSNPALSYRPAHAPRDFSTLVRDCFTLWLACLRPVFWPALGYSVASQLPWLPWWWRSRALFEHDPLRAWIAPGLFRPDWLVGGFGLLMMLVALFFALAMLRRQGLIARGLQQQTPAGDLAAAWRAFPASLLATISYLLLMLLALVPVLIGGWFGQYHDEPMVLLLALLLGLLVSAVPLAWVSIAACFIYPPILLDGHSGLSAQRASFHLVKGHWRLTAVLVTLATLAFWGLLGVVATLPLMLTGAIAFALEGLPALLRPGWLVWGQLLSAPLMALLMPLATAGYWVAYEELRLRRATEKTDSSSPAAPAT